MFSFGQDHNRRHSVGLYQNFTDYNVTLLDGNLIAWDSALSLTSRIGYQYRMSPSWLLNAGATQGFVNNQSLRDQAIERSRVYGVDAALMYAMNNGVIMSKQAVFSPYISFGYRMDYISELKNREIKPWLLLNQYALGFNLALSSRTHLQCQAAVDQKLMGDFNTHMRYRIGITQSLGAFIEPKRPIEEDIIVEHQQTEQVEEVAEVAQSDVQDSLVVENKKLHRQLTDCGQNQEHLQNQLDTLNAKLDEHYDTSADDPRPAEDQDVEETDEPEVFEPVAKQYYIIVVSVKNLKVAKNFQVKLKEHSTESVLLKQPNGFYRVGVPAGTDYKEAKKLMSVLRNMGYDPIWLIKS